jgi:predicted RNA-binding Zn-ribbon protein involved in translation (DUF1610 family)
MDEPTHGHQSHICPQCGSHRIHRSLRKGVQDLVLRRMLFQVPYRCEDCDHRFFGFRVTHYPKKGPDHHPV